MNRADDRCAGTARDGGPCTFTRAGHADSKPHAFVDAFDEVARLKGELAEAKRLLETAPVGGFAEASLEWRRRKDAFLAAPPTALNENAGGEGLGCDNCDVESPAAASCRYRNERARAAGWLVEDELVLCPRCKPAESTPVISLEAPWCYSVDCRYYGQRHATAHEPRDVEPKGAKP